MQFMGIAVAALAAAQASSGVQWVPLNSAKPAQPTPVEQTPESPPPATQAPTPAATTPAASTVPKGIVLWRNIEDAMPVSQLHAMFPPGPNVAYKADRTVLTDIPIIEGCQAKVNVLHPTGVVKEIVMRGEGSLAGRCSLKIISALSGKYGEPLEKDKVRASLLAREGKNYVWVKDGVALQFKRYTNGVLGGGGLLAASWELRYSVNPTNIDL